MKGSTDTDDETFEGALGVFGPDKGAARDLSAEKSRGVLAGTTCL